MKLRAQRRTNGGSILVAVLLGLAGCGREASPTAAAPASTQQTPAPVAHWDRDVRPILADHCFQCHGQDPGKRQAKLRLDVPEAEAPLRGGHAVVAAARPTESELWRRVTSTDPKFRMPPPDSGKPPLTAAQQATVLAWLQGGAAWEPHWSFVPPARPPLPPVRDAKWPANELDRFILARLDAAGVAPSPEADHATLLRRLFLDLTGLPPTPQELDTFLADARPDAWEQQVDTLLTQEPYVTRVAERLAGPWLDGARYADTNGIHTDAGRSIWPYRDWVLDAFRMNMPYDEFVQEQIAGDLLPGATLSQKVATGFLRSHVQTDEGGAIAEEYLAEYAAERTAVTSSVFLGLTMGCARCHDHKFDPLTQRDFYSMFACFDSVEEPGLYSQESDPKRAFEPFLEVPSHEQQAQIAELQRLLADGKRELDQPAPDDDARHAAFLAALPGELGLKWTALPPVSASSAGGATLTPQPDGSVLASGANPDKDEQVYVFHTQATDLRLLQLEALLDPSLPMGKVGRAENGNAVLTGVTLQVASLADPSARRDVPLVWAWADHEQPDGDFGVTGVLRAGDGVGWAVDAHRRDDGRVALFLADQPFGFPGGTELRITLESKSVYARHTLGRVRFSASPLQEQSLARLPLAMSGWYRVGPFPAESGAAAYDVAAGPESDPTLDLLKNFGSGNQYWTFEPELVDGRPRALSQGNGATYLGRRLCAPSARKLPLSLGSDDGLVLYLDGKQVFEHRVDRSLKPDQDQFTLELPAGEHVLVAKVVNTGGEAGFYFRATLPEDALAGDVLLAALPAAERDAARSSRLRDAWRLGFSPVYRQRAAAVKAKEEQLATAQAAIPRTMVMKERDTPRETFVLVRGQYDHPDKERPVGRDVPASLGSWPQDAPRDRLGLARWLVEPDNPLVARVRVNRLWELIFGTGLVRTSEDFGAQGEYPSHPELLDWLAVELRESGWDQRHILSLIVNSRTYRQSSRTRPELQESDPDDRLLASFPRRRLSAEQLRDQALYVSGLLVEKLGGPSVKPYQPPGLWEEVAMPASNTRVYVQGTGDELWRRSLYTYWKRACPPPSLMTLDAPTRETCVVRRMTTDTPLQALVLWNDEQFVEASRVLAARTLAEPGDDAAHVASLFRRCTARAPDAVEAGALASALADLRARYAGDEAAAKGVIAAGQAPRPMDLPTPELAAWTLLANSVLSLDATLCRS